MTIDQRAAVQVIGYTTNHGCSIGLLSKLRVVNTRDIPIKLTPTAPPRIICIMWVKQCHKPPIWEWFIPPLWWFEGWFINVLATLLYLKIHHPQYWACGSRFDWGQIGTTWKKKRASLFFDLGSLFFNLTSLFRPWITFFWPWITFFGPWPTLS